MLKSLPGGAILDKGLLRHCADDREDSTMEPKLYTAHFQLTGRCNLACRFCGQTKGMLAAEERELAVETWMNAAAALEESARAAGVKSVSMLPQKQLLPLTGYVHGGCSPVGMSKSFPTYFAEEVILVDTMICSAGKVGYQVEVAPDDLIALVGGRVADLTQQ